MTFRIDIEDSGGTKLGGGPIATARGWSYTDRLNRAGQFSFSMPASDPKSALVQAKRTARCYALINGTMTDVGAGIIDQVTARANEDGQVMLDVSGDGLLRELTYRHVGSLSIDDGAGGPDTTGPADIIALAPAGWSLDVVTGYNATVKSIKQPFEGESVLAAFVKLSEITGERFRQGAGRTVVWMKNDNPASGIRAMQGGDPYDVESNTLICLIKGLEQVHDTYDAYVGRVYAKGVGNGGTLLDLNGAVCGYAGYTVGNDSKGYYLQHTTTWNTYGIDRYMSFKDVEDVQTLFEQSYEWMRRQISAPKTYRLMVEKLATLLTPGSTLYVVYRRAVDDYVTLDIDADLVILEATSQVDQDGVHTVSLMVGEIDRWPEGEAGAIVSGMGGATAYYTHPQPGVSTPADHNHTGAADGGILTGDLHDGASDYVEIATPAAPSADHAQLFARDDGAGVTELCAQFNSGDVIPIARQGVTIETYTETNVTPTRTYDADATSVDELADVLGSLIADLRAQGIVK